MKRHWAVLWILAALVLCGGLCRSATNGPVGSNSVGGKLAPRVAPPRETTLSYHMATNLAARTIGFTNPLVAMEYLERGPCTFYQYMGKGFCATTRWSKKCWLSGVRGLSATCLGYTVTNVGGPGNPYLITMVSPRHYLFAQHTGFTSFHAGNDTAVFLATNNVVYYRKSLQETNVHGDISVGILDADLPASVGYLPVFPLRFRDWVDWMYMPGIGVNQDLIAYAESIQIVTTPPESFASVYPRFPIPFCFRDHCLTTNWTVRADPVVHGDIAAGDSSDPIRALIGNQLVLVSALTSGGGGYDYSYYADAINQKMHYLSTNNHLRTDYQLSFMSVTNWPRMVWP